MKQETMLKRRLKGRRKGSRKNWETMYGKGQAIKGKVRRRKGG